MDTILIAVTGLSLAMASALAIVVLKLLRDERRRSDARVALLSELAAAEDVLAYPVHEHEPARPAREVEVPTAPVRRQAPPDVDLDLRPDRPVAGVAELFAEPERHSPWGTRLTVAGSIAAVLLAAVFAVPRLIGGTADRNGAAAETAMPQAAAMPIELLSLAHQQEPGRLTVSGVVLNPRGAVPRSRLVATAFAFDASGGFLASGRATLDFMTLAPGEESPFVVSVPVTGEVARYRVGFRSGDGEVIAHVDRRTDTIAQK